MCPARLSSPGLDAVPHPENHQRRHAAAERRLLRHEHLDDEKVNHHEGEAGLGEVDHAPSIDCPAHLTLELFSRRRHGLVANSDDQLSKDFDAADAEQEAAENHNPVRPVHLRTLTESPLREG